MTQKIQRYTYKPDGMFYDDNGEYVLYKDYKRELCKLLCSDLKFARWANFLVQKLKKMDESSRNAHIRLKNDFELEEQERDKKIRRRTE